MEQKIKAIIFDVGGVLQTEKSSKMFGKYLAGVHGYIVDKLDMALDSWFDAIDTPYGKSFVGELDDKKVIELISSNLGISKRKLIGVYMGAMKKNFSKNKELYKLAVDLRKKGFITGILSDQWVLSKRVLIPKKDTKKFDIVIISDEVGLRKPNPQIYKLLMKKLKEKNKTIKPSEVVFIDNRKYNLKPAREIGIKVILFKSNVQLIRDLKKLKVI